MDKAFFGSVDGINVSYLENDDFKTGMSAVCVHKLKLSQVAELWGANNFHHDQLAKTGGQEIINTGLFFYSAGFHFTVFPTTVMTLVNRAKKNNKVFLINLSVPFKVEFLKDPPMAGIPFADFGFGNESVAKTLGKTAQLEKASGSHCNSAGFPYGADTAVAVHQGKVNTFDVLKRAALPIVDTSGAGGAFCVNAGYWAAKFCLPKGLHCSESCEV
ncbi:Ribokinase-like [Phytophthora cactorum]|nr:Ribokinase-like [Phytophthora cactorum]